MVLDNDFSIHLHTKVGKHDLSKIAFGQAGGAQVKEIIILKRKRMEKGNKKNIKKELICYSGAVCRLGGSLSFFGPYMLGLGNMMSRWYL